MCLIIYKYYLLARRDIDAAASKTSDVAGVDYGHNNITKTQTVDNTYDASGNLTQVGTSLGAHDLRDITWDAENRIKQISDYAGIHNNSTTQVSLYYYNDSGDRVKKIEDSATTIYPNQYESVRTETGVDTVKTKNIYVGNQRIASILTVGSSTAATYFYITDHLGSTGYLTDASGNIAEHIEYTPWGESWWEKTAASPLPGYKFTGKEKDITELYYYGARYYDPKISVWQSTDPMLDKYLESDRKGGMFNSKNFAMYTYCHENPMNLIDPTGLYTTSAEGDNSYMTMEKGDSIWGSVAKQNPSATDLQVGFRVGEIAKMNNLKNPDQVQVGQKLKMPNSVIPNITKDLMGKMEMNSKDFGIQNPFYFRDKVHRGGDWDLKSQKGIYNSSPLQYREYLFNGQIVRYDAPGNIHYGYVGSAAWYGTEGTLLDQAAQAQTKDNPNGGWTGDDPVDTGYIRMGIDLYNNR
jgi:RHS repeat-associated protein